MKLYFILIFIATCSFVFGFGQNIKATYKVVQLVAIQDEINHTKQLPLEFTGFLYKKNNKYIYFEKPNYLSKLIDGSIPISNSDNHYFIYTPNSDTVQGIEYTDFDSMILRTRSNMITSITNKNVVQKIEPESFNWMQWKLWPDTMEVNGLHCQKATMSTGSQDMWTIWFCPDILMQANLFNIKNLPGLVVEATFLPIYKTYKLEAYSISEPFKEDIFWPKVFNQAFIYEEDANKGNKSNVEKPTKIQKQKKLLNNQ